MSGRSGRVAVGVVGPIALWWGMSASGAVPPFFLPTPPAVADALAAYLGQSLPRDLWSTLFRVLGGLGLAVVSGVPIGIAMGVSPVLRDTLSPSVDFLRAVPSSTLYPLFLLFFGVGDGAQVAVVCFGCSLVMAVSTAYGFRETRERRIRLTTFKAFGASRLQALILIRLPGAMTSVLSGVRVSISLALVLVVVTEMFLGANSGLGRHIYEMYLGYRIPEMYAGIVVVGVLGYSLNLILVEVERRLLPWERDR